MSDTLASHPGMSAWVAANAGAGKTYTLANRVARLLLADAPPEKILCLTFTKAAAAEMQHRLFKQLGEWSMLADEDLREKIRAIGAAPDNLPKARRLFAKALETPGGLKVLTLHAFCQIVLTRFPVEARVPPGFDVLDEASARALMAAARQNVLERAGSGALEDAIAFLATEISEVRLGDILETALGGDRRKLDRFLERLADDVAADAVWRGHGVRRGTDPVGEFCAALGREVAEIRAVGEWLQSGTKTDRKFAEGAAGFLARGDDGEGFSHLRAWLMTNDGEPRKSLATKSLSNARPDLLAYLQDLQARFCEAEDRRRAAHAARLSEAALAVIGAVRENYDLAKRRQGVLDYDDLITKTRALLERADMAQWVLYKLDNGIDHILVDEAQDTSPEQWAIVHKLSGEFFAGLGRDRTQPRTIFAVGDEKQSIFSFQGADPVQFDINRQRFERLAGAAGQPFADRTLATSRRSAPEILQFVDRVFADPAARAGLTSRDQPIRHTAHRADAKGGIEFWTALKPPPAMTIDPYLPVDAEQPESPVILLARRVADEIQGWLRSGAALPGRDKPIAPGDIMILLPRREPFGGEVIRQLKLRDIPVAGADRVVLTEQIAVMDLIALGRFALLPEDDLNLAALLRSPLCNLGEDDLFDLCHGRGGILWQALVERKREAAFERAHIFLSDMLARADYLPPFEFFSHALTTLGGKRALIARLGPESADMIEEFLSLALTYERAHTPSLEGFLDWLSRGNTEIKRDMERGRDEVRVMTVHGAKGLEADIVILPDTTTLPDGPSRKGKGHLLYHDGDVLFPVKDGEAPARILAARQAEKDEALREHRRLFYVALTRARDRLYICGFENKRGVGDGSWYALAEEAARALGREIRRHDEPALGFGHVGHDIHAPRQAAPEAARTLPGWMTRPAPPDHAAPKLIRPSDALDAPEQTSLSPFRAEPWRFRRGNIVHALLARLPEVAPGARRARAVKFAIAQGLAREAAEALAEEVLRVLDDPAFAPAFSPSSRAEVAFLAELPELGPGAQVNGRVDRLAVTDAEVLILDFKTNRPPPSREEDVSPVYLVQMALYRAAAARIFPGRRIVCGLIWTDGPALMRLTDAGLDRQMALIRRRLDPEGEHS
jgi:ATP-dependent helicase/nuclease subunit A